MFDFTLTHEYNVPNNIHQNLTNLTKSVCVPLNLRPPDSSSYQHSQPSHPPDSPHPHPPGGGYRCALTGLPHRLRTLSIFRTFRLTYNPHLGVGVGGRAGLREQQRQRHLHVGGHQAEAAARVDHLQAPPSSSKNICSSRKKYSTFFLRKT